MVFGENFCEILKIYANVAVARKLFRFEEGFSRYSVCERDIAKHIYLKNLVVYRGKSHQPNGWNITRARNIKILCPVICSIVIDKRPIADQNSFSLLSRSKEDKSPVTNERLVKKRNASEDKEAAVSIAATRYLLFLFVPKYIEFVRSCASPRRMWLYYMYIYLNH